MQLKLNGASCQSQDLQDFQMFNTVKSISVNVGYIHPNCRYHRMAILTWNKIQRQRYATVVRQLATTTTSQRQPTRHDNKLPVPLVLKSGRTICNHACKTMDILKIMNSNSIYPGSFMMNADDHVIIFDPLRYSEISSVLLFVISAKSCKKMNKNLCEPKVN